MNRKGLILYGCLVGTNLALYLTFLEAYNNSMSVMVYINQYSEAHIELILFTFITISSLYFLIKYLRGYVVEQHG